MPDVGHLVRRPASPPMLPFSRLARPCRAQWSSLRSASRATKQATPKYPQKQLRFYSTEPPAPPRSASVFTPSSAVVFVTVLVGLVFYFRHEKAKHIEQREKERAASQYGRPKVGGPFKLMSHTGQPFTDQNLLGKWSLVYFGFTNCPDICPAELDKITAVVEAAEKKHGKIFQPVFISVDPARDTLSQMAVYLKDFHPSIVGLVGTYAETRAICKAYRVYFSTPPDADPKGDYLVDHSIFVYLMDPNGQFVEAFGQVTTSADVVGKIEEFVGEWEKNHDV
ncbi:SCO1 protein [Armillaria luteobubalina]|uniref:SCO1 protein n=1 Tax=Armillaria luteobubalina TaxID=153913 RepID=A0AA39QHE3_9AGAR|nr:SCO1 protein [Armillaria luteobubalina]